MTSIGIDIELVTHAAVQSVLPIVVAGGLVVGGGALFVWIGIKIWSRWLSVEAKRNRQPVPPGGAQ